MRASLSLVIAGMLVAGAASAAQERLLFDNPGYDVFVPESFYCDQPVRVTVRSGDPALFEQDSPEVQRIIDSTQAVLAFECPNVAGVELEGSLAGLPDPVYFAVAGPETDWVPTVRQSIESHEYESYQPPADEAYPPAGDGGGFSVANLTTGMDVEEVRATVTDTFGVEPDYRVEEGIMTMRAGGCPADYDWAALSPAPEPGWKCLEAHFTDQRQARLYLLDLVQVLAPEDPDAVEQVLTDRFGEPVQREETEVEKSWWQDERIIRTLVWGEVVDTTEAGDGGTTEIYTLQARILTMEDATVVSTTLYEPALQPQWASEPGSPIPDLTL